jgi:hypothetical protein
VIIRHPAAPGQLRSVGDLETPPVSRRSCLAVGYEELSLSSLMAQSAL